MTTTDETGRTSWAMSPRDLINIGIFAALYIVVTFAINMLGFINPAIMLVSMCAAIVAGGVPFVLFLTRVTHAGMILVFALMVSGLLVLTGHPPVSLAVTLVVAGVAELIVHRGGYRSPRSYVLAHAAYAVWYIGPWLPLFYDRDNHLESIGMDQMGASYSAKAESLLSVELMAGFGASTIVFGLLGGLLGVRLLHKHFRRAGLA
ncbi:MptD family putative ECF transporter S component [Aeromicrobium sp. CTD01-1L150]|uniref:MptD family putative ECF transporter S component n=1 Tax=Aeromicrobium sp. CTD01-1L150 TaxID=3341830 RepID=UPI0035C1C431